jgi:hypothetical protein
MGYEFHIKIIPVIENLGEVIVSALETWERIIDSSLLIVAS